MTDWMRQRVLDPGLGLRHDLNLVSAAWADPTALRIDAGMQRVAVDAEGSLRGEPPRGNYDPERHFLLGLAERRPVFAQMSSSQQLVPLRSVMDSLEPFELQAAFAAVGLVDWHATSRFCPTCGGDTSVVGAGQARRCAACETELYPRTDPAVIVAILDPEGRLLLGRQPTWAPGRLSVFAGFVEVGESLEQAVHREMAEEVGLSLGRVRYLGSQPWPFPRSLMVSFVAETLARDEPVVADGEIESAQWFTPQTLSDALAAGEASLPAAASISRRMITAWLEGRLGLHQLQSGAQS